MHVPLLGVVQFFAHAAYTVAAAFTVQFVPAVTLAPLLLMYTVPLLLSLVTSVCAELKNPRNVQPLRVGITPLPLVHAVEQVLSLYHPVAPVFLYNVVTVPAVASFEFLFNVIALQFALQLGVAVLLPLIVYPVSHVVV